jgi:hypothetical protein
MKFTSTTVMLLVILISACSPENKDNTLSAEEKNTGWQLLFDGTSTEGWHLYNRESTTGQWIVKDGELVCSPAPGKELGDLVTNQKFSNYDLKFDWKISKEGNSGVFVNVIERSDIPTAWASGPEYQLLEESHHDYQNELKRSGCIFGLSPQLNNVSLKPFGEWNQSEIKQMNGKVEFYLNGQLTIARDLTTQGWKDSIANSNFKHFPEFGKSIVGEIGLQDWNKGIAFKNIKIRQLKPI